MYIDLKKCTLTINDGASHSVSVKIGTGSLEYTERRNIEYVLDRGVLDAVAEGDEVPVDVRFDFAWEYITGATSAPTVDDALKQVGEADDWTSSDTDECQPYAVDLVFVFTPTPSTCGDIETITFTDFRYEELSHSVGDKKISCSGKCNVKRATVVRAAQS